MSTQQKINVITGAFSLTGRYISQILQKKGQKVVNLTNHPNRPYPKGQLDEKAITTFPLAYDNIDQMAEHMAGAHTLYCTYWIRYNDYQGQTRDQAVQRVRNIVDAAKLAKIKKIIYTTHTFTYLNNPVMYLHGKALAEQYIRESGISYGFAKPCVIFGQKPEESIVLNNLAYILRRFPVVPIVGDGSYPIQPVHVEDMAKICVELAESEQNQEKDAVGPEIFSFEQLVKIIQQNTNSKNLLIKGFSTDAVYNLSKCIDLLTKDKYIEKQDLDILSQNMCYSPQPATGKIFLSDWLKQNGQNLGKKYVNNTKIYYGNNNSMFSS